MREKFNVSITENSAFVDGGSTGIRTQIYGSLPGS